MTQQRIPAMTRPVTTFPSRREALRIIAAAGPGLAALRMTGIAEARKNGKGKRRRKGKRKKSSQPNPVTRVDATCIGPGASGGGDEDGNARAAQTFTALTSGQLVIAELPIIKQAESDGDYILRLAPLGADGLPTNDVLAQASFPNSQAPVGVSPVTFSFGNPASVVAGAQYALVLTRPGGGRLIWVADASVACAGRSCISPDQTAPFTVLADGFDFNFMTFIRSEARKQ